MDLYVIVLAEHVSVVHECLKAVLQPFAAKTRILPSSGDRCMFYVRVRRSSGDRLTAVEWQIIDRNLNDALDASGVAATIYTDAAWCIRDGFMRRTVFNAEPALTLTNSEEMRC